MEKKTRRYFTDEQKRQMMLEFRKLRLGGMSYEDACKRLGIMHTVMRNWLSGRQGAPRASPQAPPKNGSPVGKALAAGLRNRGGGSGRGNISTDAAYVAGVILARIRKVLARQGREVPEKFNATITHDGRIEIVVIKEERSIL